MLISVNNGMNKAIAVLVIISISALTHAEQTSDLQPHGLVDITTCYYSDPDVKNYANDLFGAMTESPLYGEEIKGIAPPGTFNIYMSPEGEIRSDDPTVTIHLWYPECGQLPLECEAYWGNVILPLNLVISRWIEYADLMALCGASSRAIGAPNKAMIPSPVISLIVPS